MSSYLLFILKEHFRLAHKNLIHKCWVVTTVLFCEIKFSLFNVNLRPRRQSFPCSVILTSKRCKPFCTHLPYIPIFFSNFILEYSFVCECPNSTFEWIFGDIDKLSKALKTWYRHEKKLRIVKSVVQNTFKVAFFFFFGKMNKPH